MNYYLSLIILSAAAMVPLRAQTPNAAPAANAPATVESQPATTNAPPAAAAAQTPSAPAEPVQPLATAVLNFQTSDDAMSKRGAELATLLQADLSNSEHALMVEREEIDKVLSEQELAASGLVSAETAAKIGSLTGAKVLVTGRLFSVGNQYMVVAKIISTETSRVYGVTATLNDLTDLPKAAQDLSRKIDGVLSSHRDVLIVQEETPDHRLQRLRDLLGKRPLPSLAISIPEQDYTLPTIDPAAQTEFTLQLQALGFQIVDPDQKDKKADILISGEAFSELGARHGNLVSSRGRIEIKLVRTATKELLYADRATEVAVDLGNHTAGKVALEKAAGKLVERLLPKLTK